MTEPARSMAASLANLEAHRPSMNATSTALDPAILEARRPSGSSAREYLGNAQRELSKLRSEILDAKVAWERKRGDLQAKFDDDLAKLNGEFAAILTELTNSARRIQATRE